MQLLGNIPLPKCDTAAEACNVIRDTEINYTPWKDPSRAAKKCKKKKMNAAKMQLNFCRISIKLVTSHQGCFSKEGKNIRGGVQRGI